jgi:predicted AlkP superfamily pyrophosphatase or phosphodiesterase
MKKLIFVLLDGTTREISKENMGYLWHLVESGNAGYADIRSELPSWSRPSYEGIFTGTQASVHGVTCNETVRRSNLENIFSVAHKAGLKTGAAAYSWFSELYVHAPFDPYRDRFLNDDNADIQHGIFYFDDNYPDYHLFLDGDYLRTKYNLDFLLIHPMGQDNAGHQFGSMSKEYELRSVLMDGILAKFVPRWVEDGYGVIVTADHGMSENGNHGGNRDILRSVFAYFINLGVPAADREYSQLSLAPTVCGILGTAPAETMKYPAIPLKPAR